MSSKSLEQYLVTAIERGQIDHALRASRDASGKVTFYIHPALGDGETLDLVVRGNELVLNLTNCSDVPVSEGKGDCPHAGPFRYCPQCVVSPCPVGLGKAGDGVSGD